MAETERVFILRSEYNSANKAPTFYHLTLIYLLNIL